MSDTSEQVPAAGNGLLDRRWFLKSGGALAGATLLSAKAGAAREPWMSVPGTGVSESGPPSSYENHVKRVNIVSQPGTTGAGSSRTPLEHLDGIITPSRLHFERHQPRSSATPPIATAPISRNRKRARKSG
jgi:sulfane dehydrogenase subunit SoxC